MAGACLQLTEDESRRCKLFHLAVDGVGAVLRYKFDQQIPTPSIYLTNTQVRLEFLQLLKRNVISRAQYDLLYPSNGTSSSKDYDITLLVALHRTLLCAKKGNDPIWQAGNTPAPTDFSTEAEIVRLRDFRNELFHLPRAGGLTQTQFDTKWNDICQVLTRFGSGMPGLKEKLNQLKNECLDKKFEKELLQKLEKWYAMDKAFGDEIMKTLQNNSPFDIALERSKRELSDVLADSYFVKTSIFKKATEILNDKGIIVIKGAQGEGKTTMGKKLVKNPNKCLKVNKCSDWDFCNTTKIDTVLIDDMFGCSMFDKGDSRKWLKYIPQIKDYIRTKRLTVIITSRSYILDEVLEKMKVSHLINENNTLTITSKALTDEEKRAILEKHIQMYNDKRSKFVNQTNKRKLDESQIKECIKEANNPSSFVIGFPECARLFCQHDQFFKDNSAFFKSPMAHIKTCLKDIFKSEQVFVAFFVLWAQKSQEISLLSLEQAVDCTTKAILRPIEQLQYRPEDILRTIRVSLLTHKTDFIYFDTKNEIFSFSHRVLRDAVGLVAYEKNGTAVLQNSDSSFIERYVRIGDKARNSHPVAEPDENANEVIITVSPLRLNLLCSRIAEIIQEDLNNNQPQQGTGNTNLLGLRESPDKGKPKCQYLKCMPLLHPAFKNAQFCEMFIEDIMKDKTLRLLTTPVSTVGADFVGFEKVLDENIFRDDICLLAFLLKNSMKQFAAVCCKEIESLCFKIGENSDSVKEVLKTDLKMAMLLAVRQSDQEMIEYLVGLGAPVDDQNVMFTAFKMANQEIVTFLLDVANKRISDYRKNGKSPLILFVEENDIEAVKCLLSNKHFTGNEIDFQSKDDPCTETALHKACRKDQDDIVEQLLLKNPQLHLRDANGYCPIHVAAMAGNVKIIKRLLEHDKKQADYPANLSYNRKRIKLYHIAVFKEYGDVLEMLEQMDISPECTDDKKQIPLLFALQENKYSVVRKTADVSIKHDVHMMSDNRGNTALHVAIEKLRELKNPKETEICQEVISLLCRNGIDVNLPNMAGKSPLQLACENKLYVVEKELKKYEISRVSFSERTYTEDVHGRYETEHAEAADSECDAATHTPAKRAKHT